MFAVALPRDPLAGSGYGAIYRAPRLRVCADGAMRNLSVRLSVLRGTRTNVAWGAAVRPLHRSKRVHDPPPDTSTINLGNAAAAADVAQEDADTAQLLRRAPACAQPDAAALAPVAQRWGVPLAAVVRSPHARRGPAALLRFYRRRLRGRRADARICLLLGGSRGSLPALARERLHVLANDVLGASAAGAIYARHPDITAVLLASVSGAHAHLPAVDGRLMREAALSEALLRHEQCGALDRCLGVMTPTRVGMCLSDLSVCTAANGRVKLIKLVQYCADRSLLTNRAIAGVFAAHVRSPSDGMTRAEFVALFAALVDCGKPASMRYWFYVLDVDGDGQLGRQDIADFYRARKAASEARNGVRLASARALWTRLIDMAGRRPLTLHTLLSFSAKQREFVLCALLVRRPDDGHLVDLRKSLKDGG